MMMMMISIENTRRGPGDFGDQAPLLALQLALSRSDWLVRAHKKKSLDFARLFALCCSNLAARARFWLARTLLGSIFEAKTR